MTATTTQSTASLINAGNGNGTTRRNKPTFDVVSVFETGLPEAESGSEDRSAAEARSESDQGSWACSCAISANTSQSGGVRC